MCVLSPQGIHYAKGRNVVKDMTFRFKGHIFSNLGIVLGVYLMKEYYGNLIINLISILSPIH